jgi:hypothetical protein
MSIIGLHDIDLGSFEEQNWILYFYFIL